MTLSVSAFVSALIYASPSVEKLSAIVSLVIYIYIYMSVGLICEDLAQCMLKFRTFMVTEMVHESVPDPTSK